VTIKRAVDVFNDDKVVRKIAGQHFSRYASISQLFMSSCTYRGECIDGKAEIEDAVIMVLLKTLYWLQADKQDEG